MKTFIDGTPIPEGYEEQLTGMLHDACDAEDEFTIDELETYAKEKQREQPNVIYNIPPSSTK